MPEKIISDLIINVQKMNKDIAVGTFEEIKKLVGSKYKNINEAAVKFSVNNMISKALTDISMSIDNKDINLEESILSMIQFMQGVLVTFASKKTPDLIPRVQDFGECLIDLLDKVDNKKSPKELEKIITLFLEN